MFSFFKSMRSMHPQHARGISTVKKFILKDTNRSDGYLIKFTNTEKSDEQAKLIREEVRKIIQSFPDSLFIFTMPTIYLSGEYGSFPYPGHNFVLISNPVTQESHEGNILSCMSKRPDTTAVFAKRRRAQDARFSPSYAPVVTSFLPRFTSLEEEMNIWEKNAKSVSRYPLFAHIIPIKPELNIDAKSFQHNVSNIIEYNIPYSLHSTHHPTADHLIPPANCNGAMHEAIFGSNDILIQKMFCQEAVMTILKSFVTDWVLYEAMAREIGLANGIKPASITEEDYRTAFTC